MSIAEPIDRLIAGAGQTPRQIKARLDENRNIENSDDDIDDTLDVDDVNGQEKGSFSLTMTVMKGEEMRVDKRIQLLQSLTT